MGISLRGQSLLRCATPTSTAPPPLESCPRRASTLAIQLQFAWIQERKQEWRQDASLAVIIVAQSELLVGNILRLASEGHPLLGDSLLSLSPSCLLHAAAPDQCAERCCVQRRPPATSMSQNGMRRLTISSFCSLPSVFLKCSSSGRMVSRERLRAICGASNGRGQSHETCFRDPPKSASGRDLHWLVFSRVRMRAATACIPASSTTRLRQIRCREFVNFIDFTRTQSNVVPTAVSKQANSCLLMICGLALKEQRGLHTLHREHRRIVVLAWPVTVRWMLVKLLSGVLRGGSSVDILQRKNMVAACVQLLWWCLCCDEDAAG